MSYPDISRDPPRDPELASWLAEANPGGTEELDGDRLKAAILARAQLPLAGLRRMPLWWEYAASWARPAVPVAIAAGVALAFVVGNLPLPGLTPGTEAAAALPALEDVLTHQLPDAEYNLLVSGEGETDALLTFAMQETQ